MNSSAFPSRRALCRIFGLAGLARTLRLPLGATGQLRWDAQPDSRTAFTRFYRADAQVILLSVPLLRRQGVGAGSATWSENDSVRLLDFTGYSVPERAAGLNRFGLIRELSRKHPEPAESIYFGLMTASPEESAAEARNALHKQAREQIYTAIEGRIAPGDLETVTSRFTASASLSAARTAELLALARQALSRAPRRAPEFNPGRALQRTFLQALADLLQDPTQSHTQYIYNARLYSLWLRRYADPKATAFFRGKGQVPEHSKVIRAEGRLRREAGGKETSFQVWVEEGARPMPMRIEYQAKPYLRLTFEAEAAGGRQAG